MTVKTHIRRESDLNHEDHNCTFCERDARYWSQNEDAPKDAPPLGGVVFHCQTHREEAHRVAETTPKHTSLEGRTFKRMFLDNHRQQFASSW